MAQTSLHCDDDLPFRTTRFDISQRISGLLKSDHLVDDRSDHA